MQPGDCAVMHVTHSLTWLTPLLLWCLFYQWGSSTAYRPMLLSLLNPTWGLLPSSQVWLLFSTCSCVSLFVSSLQSCSCDAVSTSPQWTSYPCPPPASQRGFCCFLVCCPHFSHGRSPNHTAVTFELNFYSFGSSFVDLQGSRVKIREHIYIRHNCTQDPPQPQD